MRHCLHIWIALCLIPALLGVAWGEHRDEKVILNLSTVEAFKPFVWKEEGGARGIDVDIVMEICRRMDMICNLEFHPWKRVLSRVKSGQSAGGFSGFRTPEREGYAHFLSHPLHFSTYNIFVKSGQEFDFSQISDLYGKTIGIERGFAVSREFNQAVDLGRIRIQETDSLEQNIKKLLAGGRIDAVIGNYHKMQIKVSELKVQCELSCLPTPIVTPRPSYLMISRKWEHPDKGYILQRLNATLKSMYDDGSIDRINAGYLN